MSRGTAAQLSRPQASVDTVDQSDDVDEPQAEAAIMDAIRAAYQREQTRKRAPAHGDNKQVDRAEKDGRINDESDIAHAIHGALKTVGDRDTVKAILLRCLRRLEDEEAQEIEAAVATGADQASVREEKDRDVRIVEEETGRMWRQQSANQTTEEVTDSIGRFIDGLRQRGETLAHSLAARQLTQRSDELQQDRWAEEGVGGADDGGRHSQHGGTACCVRCAGWSGAGCGAVSGCHVCVVEAQGAE